MKNIFLLMCCFAASTFIASECKTVMTSEIRSQDFFQDFLDKKYFNFICSGDYTKANTSVAIYDLSAKEDYKSIQNCLSGQYLYKNNTNQSGELISAQVSFNRQKINFKIIDRYNTNQEAYIDNLIIDQNPVIFFLSESLSQQQKNGFYDKVLNKEVDFTQKIVEVSKGMKKEKLGYSKITYCVMGIPFVFLLVYLGWLYGFGR